MSSIVVAFFFAAFADVVPIVPDGDGTAALCGGLIGFAIGCMKLA